MALRKFIKYMSKYDGLTRRMSEQPIEQEIEQTQLDNLKEINLRLVRHGEATHNVDKDYTSIRDTELTENGRTQALEAGKKIIKENPNYWAGNYLVFSSGLLRAIETIVLVMIGSGINPIGINIKVLQGLEEWKNGHGCNYGPSDIEANKLWIENKYPGVRIDTSDYLAIRVGDTEESADYFHQQLDLTSERALKVFDYMVSHVPVQQPTNIICGSHGAFIQCAQSRVMGALPHYTTNFIANGNFADIFYDSVNGWGSIHHAPFVPVHAHTTWL